MICMMNVPYVVLKYATLLLSFPINNVVEVVLTTLSAIWKSTIHLILLIYKRYDDTTGILYILG